MRGSGKLTVRSVPVRHVDPQTIDSMWRLYAAHYDNVIRAQFERDLAEKQLVFLGFDTGTGELVAFSTAIIYRHQYRGSSVGVYFSGDTIVHPRYWGQKALHMAVLRKLVAWKLCHPFRPLYWHLICSGYRTYLTMVRNFPNHWPHYRRGLPEWERGLIDSIASERFGAHWHSPRGVVATGGRQVIVKREVAPLTPAVMALPEIRFFVEINPAYAHGDELAMIGLVNLAMVARVIWKWVYCRCRRLGVTLVPARTRPVRLRSGSGV